MNLLVVDDNPEQLRQYATALQRLRFPAGPAVSNPGDTHIDIDVAETVSEACHKLQETAFDILVVDMRMPGPNDEEMGGLFVIEESLKLDRLRTVIAITGFGTIDLAKITLRQGVFDFIEKTVRAVDDLVSSVQKAIAHREASLVRFGNPFSRMCDEEPSVFGGRLEELKSMQERLARMTRTNAREHFLVLGDWGIGKSTLLREFKRMCQVRDCAAAIVRLQPLDENAGLIDAARTIIEGVLRDLPYPVTRFKRVLSFFDSVGITVLGSGLQFGRNTTTENLSSQAFLHDSLTELARDLDTQTNAIVILLDDLDNFMSQPDIVMTLKQTLSMDSVRDAPILFGLACPSQHWHQLTSLERHHPVTRYFLHRTELGALSCGEVRETVLSSLAGTGVVFDRGIVDRVYSHTQGHPFEMQVLCHNLFSSQLSGRVGEQTWQKALEATVKDMGMAVFDQWYSTASHEEGKVLSVIAASNEPVSLSRIREAIRSRKWKKVEKNVAKYIQRLRTKNLIAKSGRGHYFVADPMFRTYLQMLLPENDKHDELA